MEDVLSTTKMWIFYLAGHLHISCKHSRCWSFKVWHHNRPLLMFDVIINKLITCTMCLVNSAKSVKYPRIFQLFSTYWLLDLLAVGSMQIPIGMLIFSIINFHLFYKKVNICLRFGSGFFQFVPQLCCGRRQCHRTSSCQSCRNDMHSHKEQVTIFTV